MTKRKLHSRRVWYWSNERIVNEFPDEHPARVYLTQFYKTRETVCGRDIEWPARPRVEQVWHSELLGRPYSFSSFAYSFLSFDLTMEEWLDEQYSSELAGKELERIAEHAMKMALLDECERAAAKQGNDEIIGFVHLVTDLLTMSIDIVAIRLKTDANTLFEKWGKGAKEMAESWITTNYKQ